VVETQIPESSSPYNSAEHSDQGESGVERIAQRPNRFLDFDFHLPERKKAKANNTPELENGGRGTPAGVEFDIPVHHCKRDSFLDI
jgi:hypothetical protein